MKRNIRRRSCLQAMALGGASVVLGPIADARAGAPPPDAPAAVVGGELWRGDERIKDAVIITEGGLIKSVTSGGSVPPNMNVVHAQGHIITAGFVDLLTKIGTVEVDLEKSTRDDHAQPRDETDPVRAAFLSADGYNPFSSLIPIARIEGVTSVGVVPVEGLVTGQSAWADLAGTRASESIAKPSMALHINLHDYELGGFQKNRGTAFLRLRELLDDARAYKQDRAGYDRRQLRQLGASRLDLEVVARALDGTLPVVFHVDRASDILTVLRLAKDNGLRLVLASAAEGWKVAKDIAAAKVAAIIYPLDHGPRQFAALGAREDNAKLLHAAGVTIALSVGWSHNVRKLRQVAGNAVRAGLPPAAAIEALTTAPAKIMGMDDYGSVETQRVANLVAWSGDPFELSTRVTGLVIRGKRIDLRSRQTTLYERHR